MTFIVMREAITRFLRQLDPSPVRVWSLIVTIYGDAVMPRGGEVWLGTLSEMLVPFGVEPGSVRAAVSRLARDGLLQRRRVGRTSHYALSADALAMSRAAEALIYRTRAPQAPAGWDLLLALPPRGADRSAFAGEGYTALLPGLHVRPHRADAPRRGERGGEAIALRASGDDRALAETLYPLAAIATRYRAFLEALPLLPSPDPAAPPDSLAVRIALVHGFRRIALRDPHLNAAALPADWPADAAYGAFARHYRAHFDASEAWLDAHGQRAAGALPAHQRHNRFKDAESANVLQYSA